MTAKLYGGGRRAWRHPDKCDCGKIPYRDEAATLAAAGRGRSDNAVGFARWLSTRMAECWSARSAVYKTQALSPIRYALVDQQVAADI